MERELNRRTFLRRTVVASAGSTLALSLEEKALLAQMQKNATATNQTAHTEDTKGMPCGRIGNVTISRLILGGNLIGGAAHSRDLIYTSQLIWNYFTDEKIMETWQIAEEAGINTMSALYTKQFLRVFDKYRKEIGGKIQWLGHTSFNTDSIKTAIDNGAVGISAVAVGMTLLAEVDNDVRASFERHAQLDDKSIKVLRKAAERMWANLPDDYNWLKNWEWV